MKTRWGKKTRAVLSLLTVGLLATAMAGGCAQSGGDDYYESEYVVYEYEDVSQDGATAGEPSGGTVPSDASQAAPSDTVGPSGKDVNASPGSLKDSNVTVCWPITVDDHPEFTAINKAFEKKYGGKVTVVGTGNYDDRAARLTNLVQSKTQVDVVFTGSEDYPSYALSKLIRPVDTGKFDLTKYPYNYDTFTKVNGETYYLKTTNQYNPGQLTLFNKTIFENAGLKTPLQLYQEGKWTWDSFRDAARTLSQDTNADGKNDIFGFADYDINGLLCSNGVSLLNYDGKNFTPNTGDGAKRAYQLYYDMYNVDKSITGDPWSWSTDMTQGKLGMVFQDASQILYWKQQNTAYEYDFAPLPKGPDAKEHYRSDDEDEIFSIGATAKNLEGAYAYIKFYVEEWQKRGFYNEKTGSAKFSADQEKRISEYKKLAVNSYSPTGFGNLKMDARSLLWEIRGGKSVGAVLEYWNNVLKQDIDIAMMSNG